MTELYKSTIFDDPSTESERLVISAIKMDNVSKVMLYLHKTNWTPFDVLLLSIFLAIHEDHQSTVVFKIMLSHLSHLDTTRTFSYNDVEHTLLSFCCSRPFYKSISYRITCLVQSGCNFDQEIGFERKTALSFMVPMSQKLSLVQWCIETMGANPRKGYLLHYACNFITRDTHEERVLSGEWSYFNVHRNLDMYQYLLSLGLNVEECMDTTGLTPLLAACSEGNAQKVYSLLQAGGINISLNRKTKEGLDVWFWANHYKNNNGTEYPMKQVLLAHKAEQSRYWKEMMKEATSQMSLLQEIPVRDVLLAVANV